MDIWTITGAVLTLIVLSRIAGDNPIFRLSQYLFVGLSLGFSVIILWSQILQFWQPAFEQGEPAGVGLIVVPLLLGLLLLSRLGGQRLSWIANLPLGILFGVAAALAAGGALLGTTLPQIQATVTPTQAGADLATQIGSWIVLPLGVILVLLSFTYTGKQAGRGTPLWCAISSAGRWLLIGSLGGFFAGAMLTFLNALVERVDFLIRLAAR